MCLPQPTLMVQNFHSYSQDQVYGITNDLPAFKLASHWLYHLKMTDFEILLFSLSKLLQ